MISKNYIKKIIAITSIIFYFMSVSVNANEIILKSDDVFKIITNSSIINSDNKIYLNKDSDLKITTELTKIKNIDGTIEYEEFNLLILNIINEKNEVVFFMDILDTTIDKKNISIINNKYVLNIPVTFPQGSYIIKIDAVDFNSKKYTLSQDFLVSSTRYNLDSINVHIENNELFGNIMYSNFNPETSKEENNKFRITILNGDNEIFIKEEERIFSGYGMININENILKTIDSKLPVIFKVEVLDSNNSILISKTKVIEYINNVPKYSTFEIALFSLCILIVLLLIILLFLNKKFKKSKALIILLMLFSTTFFVDKVKASSHNCGIKPSDTCVNSKILTNLCQTSDTCDTSNTLNTRVFKFFSTGNVKNIESPRAWVGPVSASVDVCTNISGLGANDSFYLIADKEGSDWIAKRYAIFEFKKGTPLELRDTPYSKKTNNLVAKYNGDCTINLSSYYSGKSSNYKHAQVKIIEVGKISTDMCKSIRVNSSIFYSLTDNLINRIVCSGQELYEGYISSGKFLNIESPRAWVGPVSASVDVCTNISGLGANDSFYLIADKEGSDWIAKRYAIFEFKKGTPLELRDTPYSKKTNNLVAKYNGDCTINLSSYYSGKSSDYKHAQVKIIEVGKFSLDVCKATSPKKEEIFYNIGGNYDLMKYCEARTTNISQCVLDSKWIPSQTSTTCDVEDDGCVCKERDKVCLTNNIYSTSTNDVSCKLFGSCVVEIGSTKNTLSVRPFNAIGNITYKQGASSTVLTKSSPYVKTFSKQNNDAYKIEVSLTDSDGQTATTYCYVDETKITSPPEIILNKKPLISLDKGGKCIVGWDLKNMPQDANCTISGGDTSEIIKGTGSKSFGPLFVNTKYIVACSGLNPAVLPKSVICRINPAFNEI